MSRCEARPFLSLTRLLHLSAEAAVPTADPLSRRYDQQDHCCCEDAGHTECPAGGSMHAYLLPTNVDCDEAAVVSAVVPSMSST